MLAHARIKMAIQKKKQRAAKPNTNIASSETAGLGINCSSSYSNIDYSNMKSANINNVNSANSSNSANHTNTAHLFNAGSYSGSNAFHASALINGLIEKLRAELASKKQIRVLVKPGKRKTELLSYDADRDAFIVSVKQKPEKGRANSELITLLEKITRKRLAIKSGFSSRLKAIIAV